MSKLQVRARTNFSADMTGTVRRAAKRCRGSESAHRPASQPLFRLHAISTRTLTEAGALHIPKISDFHAEAMCWRDISTGREDARTSEGKVASAEEVRVIMRIALRSLVGWVERS